MTEDMVEEREKALDLSKMPKSFPIGQAGEPTPGTTNLNEPPQGAPKPPNQGPAESYVINIEDDEQPPGFSTLHRIATLETLLVTVSQQLSDWKSSVFANTRTAEEAKKTQMPVLKVRDENTLGASFAQYNLAQEDCKRVWSLATLETGSGQL